MDIDSKLELIEEKLKEEKEEMIKRFLRMRTCMNVLDDDEYVEISLMCDQLRGVANLLANWESKKEQAINDCKRDDYYNFINNYRR